MKIVAGMFAGIVGTILIVYGFGFQIVETQPISTERIYEVVGMRPWEDSVIGAFYLVVKDHGDIRVLNGYLLSPEFPPKIPRYVIEVKTNGRIDYKPFEIQEIQDK